jgi:hypothetical protein
VSSAATCRSVLPAMFPEGLTRTAIGSVLTQATTCAASSRIIFN